MAAQLSEAKRGWLVAELTLALELVELLISSNCSSFT